MLLTRKGVAGAARPFSLLAVATFRAKSHILLLDTTSDRDHAAQSAAPIQAVGLLL
jgi:hypothetical protein